MAKLNSFLKHQFRIVIFSLVSFFRYFFLSVILFLSCLLLPDSKNVDKTWGKFQQGKPWSDSYGRRFMFQRGWVWIPNTAYWMDIFSHQFVVKIVMFVWLVVIQLLHSLHTNNNRFSSLVRTILVKLEWSYPYGECSLHDPNNTIEIPQFHHVN